MFKVVHVKNFKIKICIEICEPYNKYIILFLKKKYNFIINNCFPIKS
jgi:hypothetical protein